MSLCYQPDDDGVGSLLSDGLFGDAVAAAVVRGIGGTGGGAGAQHLIPDTEHWVSYAVRATGFHFQLDRRAPGTMEPLAPMLMSARYQHLVVAAENRSNRAVCEAQIKHGTRGFQIELRLPTPN